LLEELPVHRLSAMGDIEEDVILHHDLLFSRITPDRAPD
jgi:hypothetical protein